MKIHFLGTAADLEPMRGIHPQAMAIETGDFFYFFDAGDAVHRSVRFMGLDYLKINKIIISHPHMGHIGGLGYLLFSIRKEMMWQKRMPECGEVELYVPDRRIWEGFQESTQIGNEPGFQGLPLEVHEFKDGVLFEDENMKVTAYHNHHMGIPKDGQWRSFSFVIEAEGKKLIYSGDISDYEELLPLIGEGCDAIFAETGRHDYREICLSLRGKHVDTLFFTHHGRELLCTEEAVLHAQELFDGNVVICADRSSLIL